MSLILPMTSHPVSALIFPRRFEKSSRYLSEILFND